MYSLIELALAPQLPGSFANYTNSTCHRHGGWNGDFIVRFLFNFIWFSAVIRDKLYFLSLFINMSRCSTFSLERRHVFMSRTDLASDELDARAFGGWHGEEVAPPVAQRRYFHISTFTNFSHFRSNQQILGHRGISLLMYRMF